MNSMLSSGRPFTSLFTSTGCNQHVTLKAAGNEYWIATPPQSARWIDCYL